MIELKHKKTINHVNSTYSKEYKYYTWRGRSFTIDGKHELTYILKRKLTYKCKCKICDINFVSYSKNENTCSGCKHKYRNNQSKIRARKKHGFKPRKDCRSDYALWFRKKVQRKLSESLQGLCNKSLLNIVFICDKDGSVYKHNENKVNIPRYRRENGLAENQFYSNSVVKSKTIMYFTEKNGQADIKKCSSCESIKSLYEFSKQARGYRSWCKQCASEAKEKYRLTDGFKYSADRRMRKVKSKADGTVTRKAISEMLHKQNHECVYCKLTIGYGNMHKDHIVPIARGGCHTVGNIQLLCPTCNLKKHSMTHDEYIAKIS